MSSSKIFKFTIAMVAVTVLAYFAAANFLGPGVSDFSDSLIDGYSYSDAGHYEKTIVYSGSRGESKIIIDARVDDWRIEEDSLYVARRPREIYQEDQVTKSRLSPECEYWVVDTKTHSVKRLERAGGVNCK